MKIPAKFDLGDKIQISPSIWPDRELKIQPGDLSLGAPAGNAVYGYQRKNIENPFSTAPTDAPCGGVIYFGCDILKDNFKALLQILGIQPDRDTNIHNDYAIFTAESEQPGKDGYLAQLRVVSKFGLRFMFNALNDAEYDKYPKQELSIGEVLWMFIEHEKKRWGTSLTENHGLAGKFGGDGDYAREKLAFGLMVENHYYNVYRIWSRAWLVTK